MSEIPDDIMKAADNAWNALSDLPWPVRDKEVACIASAILAERQRCHAICDSTAKERREMEKQEVESGWTPDVDVLHGQYFIAKCLADDILKGTAHE